MCWGGGGGSCQQVSDCFNFMCVFEKVPSLIIFFVTKRKIKTSRYLLLVKKNRKGVHVFKTVSGFKKCQHRFTAINNTEYSRQFVWNLSSNSNTLPPRFHKWPKFIFFQTGILNSDPTIFLHPIIFCVTQSNLSFSSLLSDKSCRQIPQILIFPNPVSKHPVRVSFDNISRKGIHRKAHNSIRID